MEDYEPSDKRHLLRIITPGVNSTTTTSHTALGTEPNTYPVSSSSNNTNTSSNPNIPSTNNSTSSTLPNPTNNDGDKNSTQGSIELSNDGTNTTKDNNNKDTYTTGTLSQTQQANSNPSQNTLLAWYDINDPRRNIQWYPSNQQKTILPLPYGLSTSSSVSSSSSASVHYSTSLKTLGSQDNTKLSLEEQSKLHDDARDNGRYISSAELANYPSTTTTTTVPPVLSSTTINSSTSSVPVTPSLESFSSNGVSSGTGTLPSQSTNTNINTTPQRRSSKSSSSASLLQQPKVAGKVIYAHSDGLFYAFAPKSQTRKLPVYLPYPKRPSQQPNISSSSNVSNTAITNPKPRPSLPLLPPEGGWRILQSKVSVDDDPKEILYHRIRIFWPLDNEWYSGRILRYHPPTQEHFIRFDDGDERWYNLDDREYIIVDEYEHQIDGQKITIEASPNQWYTANILQYDPLLDMHHIQWLDGNASSIVTNESKGEPSFTAPSSSSTETNGKGNVGPSPYPAKNSEELANLHLRNHFLLVDITTLPAGEPILGRRVTVYLPEKHDIATGTITNYTLSQSKTGSSSSSSKKEKIGPVSNISFEKKENEQTTTTTTESKTDDASVPPHTSSGSTPGTSASFSSLLVGLGTSLAEGIRQSSQSLTNPTEFELSPPSVSMENGNISSSIATISPMSIRLDESPSSKNVNINQPKTPLPDRSPSLGYSSSPMYPRTLSNVTSSPLLLPISPLLNRTPSYMPRPVQPDPDATVKIILDEGKTMVSLLRNLSFTWLPYKIPGTPKGPGLVGLVNLGNTCYLNAILQVLGRVDSLTAYCLDDSFINQIKMDNKWGMQGRMAMSYTDILRHLWGDTCIALAPAFIKGLLSEKNTTFNGLGQQDAHEALMCLLDGIHEDLAVPDQAASKAAEEDAEADALEDEQEKINKALALSGNGTTNGQKFGSSFLSSLFGRNKRSPTEISSIVPVPSDASATLPVPVTKKYVETTSIIKQLFFVQTMAEFVCSKHRKHVQFRHGPRGGEMLPPLPLAPKQSVKTSFFKQPQYRNPQLVDCLNNFFTSETVERKCSHCNNKQVPMNTRPWLKNLPPILVIQLKRFEYSMVTNEHCKLSDPIAFPLRDLDMGPYVYNSKHTHHSSSARNKPPPHHNPSSSSSSGDSGSTASVTKNPQADTSSNSSIVNISSPPLGNDTTLLPPFNSGTEDTGNNRSKNVHPSNTSSRSLSPPPMNKTKSTTILSSLSAKLKKGSSSSSDSDADKTAVESTIYDLFGVVCHMGSSERGHYTVFARNTTLSYGNNSLNVVATKSNGTNGNKSVSTTESTASSSSVPLPPTWYYYDDTQVYQIKEEELLSERVSTFAYLLFYVKRLPGAPAPPLPPPSIIPSQSGNTLLNTTGTGIISTSSSSNNLAGTIITNNPAYDSSNNNYNNSNEKIPPSEKNKNPKNNNNNNNDDRSTLSPESQSMVMAALSTASVI